LCAVVGPHQLTGAVGIDAGPHLHGGLDADAACGPE
jgi:hypothetical protein